MSETKKDGKGLSRRTITLLWVAGVSALIIFLLYKEQIAILYLLATLSVTALLVIVATADLSGAKDLSSGRGESENAD